MKRWIVVAFCMLSASCMATGDKWGAYIKNVSSADHATIQGLPQKVKSIGDDLDDNQSQEFATAISIALLRDPINVLKVTDVIENYTDVQQQRYGTSFICSIPGITHYTKLQTERYFAQAEPVLENAGKPAAECLNNMRDVMAEIRAENT